MSARQKREMREEMKRVITNLDERWMKAASKQICDQLGALLEEELESTVIDHILAWTSFFPGEVDLGRFIESQLDRRAVYLPRALEDSSMRFLRVGKDWLDTAERGTFGMLEPHRSGEEYDAENAPRTLILVPGLAFDRRGNRLGRGKGCYDLFLGRKSMLSSVSVGVCWSLQVVPEVPVDSHDINMGWVCHEEALIRTGGDFEDEDF